MGIGTDTKSQLSHLHTGHTLRLRFGAANQHRLSRGPRGRKRGLTNASRLHRVPVGIVLKEGVFYKLLVTSLLPVGSAWSTVLSLLPSSINNSTVFTESPPRFSS